jgi:hypothetical protein
MQLQFEIRKIPAFQNVTRVLAASRGTVDMQLGKDMGIKVGDEYAVIKSDILEGLLDEREVGLVLVNEVGTTRSRATVLYSKIPLEKDVQLREIPRLGVDLAFYAHSYSYWVHPFDNDLGFVIGARGEATRGFYNLRPYLAAQFVFDADLLGPINVILGGQYSMFLRRLELGGRAGLAGGTNILVEWIRGKVADDDDWTKWLSHYGGSVGAYASFLISRDVKLFAEVQADYMFGHRESYFGPIFGSYSGYQVGLGVTLKQ